MAILVTGGAGFIGSHLVEKLVERKERVVVVDDFNDYYSPSLKRANAARIRSAGDVSIVEGDIRDASLMRKVFDDFRPERVVHLAARAGVRPSLADPRLYVDVNIAGTVNVLELARHSGVRSFVLASSSSVYGSSRDVPFREDARCDTPASPYGATKRACELLAWNYHHLYGLRSVCLRFFTAYGPRQRPDMAVHKFTRAIFAGQPVPFFGDGTAARDYTYIDDIVSGVVAAACSGLDFEILNLGDSDPVSLSDMVKTIAAAVGREPVLDRQPDQPGDVPITFADISKARRLLGFAPKVSFEDGIRRFVAWYRDARTQGLVD